MSQARDERMRLLYKGSCGHTFAMAARETEAFCYVCHPEFDWLDLATPVPMTQLTPITTEGRR